MPQSLDERIAIELFAEAPEIVTPIGLVVDRQGRVIVVESHTHFRPEGYEGPAADRIRIFEDTNGDGKADHVSTFFEGSEQTMSIALADDGGLFVATRREVFLLHDDDADGVAERQTPIARLVTEGNYPHNGLSGLTLDGFGNVYFALGENLGAPYELVGSDGTTIGGGGEGGSIFRCRTDGTELERFATGFWNTFSLAFDVYGNLFAVDNDPDSRPPCRLLHVVSGGDYGYRFRNGRAGLHPFTSWDGELPGTLPMVNGVGDAPSGVIAYEFGSFPDDFQGDLLVTSAWIHHRIERHRLHREGASYLSTAEVLIQGDDRFRPVDIAAAPDGSLYVTDWVDPSYNVHRMGRIWRIHAKDAEEDAGECPSSDPRERLNRADVRVRREAARTLVEQKESEALLRETLQSSEDARVRVEVARALAAHGSNTAAELGKAMRNDSSDEVRAAIVRQLPATDIDWLEIVEKDDSPLVQAAALRRAELSENDGWVQMVLAKLGSDDPFVRQAARDVLVRSPQLIERIDANELSGSELLGVAIAARTAGVAGFEQHLGSLLQHEDPKVRFFATQWIGEGGLSENRSILEERLAAPETIGTLLKATLTSLALLDGVSPKDAEREGDTYLAGLFERADLPDASRLAALRMLPADHPSLTIERLRELLTSENEALQVEAVRALRESGLEEKNEILFGAALNSDVSPAVRAEAIVGLNADNPQRVVELIELAGSGDGMIRREALRSLYGVTLTTKQQETLNSGIVSGRDEVFMLRRLTNPSFESERPSHDDLDRWLDEVPNSGDAAAGQRVFFHPRLANCGGCHRVAGRGESIGPELTYIARSMDRRKLLETILQPSREIAPHYQSWAIETSDGRSLVAMLIRRGGAKSTFADRNGNKFELSDDEIELQVPQPLSIMPEGLLDPLTTKEVADLLAYLSQRR